MTFELAFSLLNPAISLLLAVTFFGLSRRRPSYRYPSLLALAFLLGAVAFMANDFLRHFDGPGLRIFLNALFWLAVLVACSSALVRIGAQIPATAIVALSAGCAAGFFWFLFAEPSTVARIYIMNAGYAAITLFTAVTLIQAKPDSLVDWLFVAFTLLLLMLAILRPLAIFMGGLDTAAAGSLADSSYWASIQAMTPLLALILALLFVAAFAIRVFSEVRDEADHDYLTGLLNRRGFEARAASALTQAGTRPWKTALMIADIDNFKTVNDTFGHATGDEVIATVGRILAEHANAPIVARTGGEEFALLYEDASRRELLAHAAVVRAEMARAHVRGLPRGYPLSMSIGIHDRQPGEALDAMMRRADEALYVAKASGKDQAIMTRQALRTVKGINSAKAH